MKIDYALLLLKSSGFPGGPCTIQQQSKRQVESHGHTYGAALSVKNYHLKNMYLGMLTFYEI
jgi:hypothetical protein